MKKLSHPYEIFDIGDGEAVQIRVVKAEEGEVEIHPGYGDRVKTVEAIRLFLEHPWKEGLMGYIDITSQRLRANLRGTLKNIPTGGKLIRITKKGVAPDAVFIVEQIPEGK